MSLPSPSNRPSRFRKAFRDLITAPRLDLSDLMTVVQAVAEASTALYPLQPAAVGLLKAIEMVEVWFFSIESYSISVVVGFGGTDIGPKRSRYRGIIGVFLQTRRDPQRSTARHRSMPTRTSRALKELV